MRRSAFAADSAAMIRMMRSLSNDAFHADDAADAVPLTRVPMILVADDQIAANRVTVVIDSSVRRMQS